MGEESGGEVNGAAGERGRETNRLGAGKQVGEQPAGAGSAAWQRESREEQGGCSRNRDGRGGNRRGLHRVRRGMPAGGAGASLTGPRRATSEPCGGGVAPLAGAVVHGGRGALVRQAPERGARRPPSRRHDAGQRPHDAPSPERGWPCMDTTPRGRPPCTPAGLAGRPDGVMGSGSHGLGGEGVERLPPSAGPGLVNGSQVTEMESCVAPAALPVGPQFCPLASPSA